MLLLLIPKGRRGLTSTLVCRSGLAIPPRFVLDINTAPMLLNR